MKITMPTVPSRRRFIRLASGGTLLAALPMTGTLTGCQVFQGMPDSATQSWQGPRETQQDIRLRTLAWAILAPNPHNRQPWFATLRGEDRLELSLDTDRLLPATDPYSRQILIGTGALLGILEIAAAENGYAIETDYFPEGEFGLQPDDRTVASIRFIDDPAARLQKDTMLFSAIPERRTQRGDYLLDRPPASDFIDDLDAENQRTRSSGLTSGVIEADNDAAMFTGFANDARNAWRIETTTPYTMLESMKLLRIGAREINLHRDGISLTAPMLVLLNRFGMIDRDQAPDADSSVVQGMIAEFNQAMDSTPALFWLGSRGNGRIDQLEAGKAYVRAQLHATRHGLAMHPLSQALQEYPEVSKEYTAMHARLGEITGSTLGSTPTLQMLCRLGYPASGAESSTPSPRRGLDAHVRPVGRNT